MDLVAPVPQHGKASKAMPENMTQEDNSMYDPENPSVVKVTVVGCGGAGINISRSFINDPRVNTLYFDTSKTNTRRDEKVFVMANGDGSGSHRAENAAEIERTVSQLSDEEMGIGDVAIVISSLGGGSGSVINPLLIREYNRRGVRVIGVAVADTSYSVAATNSHNTLKTLTAIAKNNKIYLPMIIVSNDQASRRDVDTVLADMIHNLINLLTQPVHEVDRNDRLNWINPTKVVDSPAGIKLISLNQISTKNKIVLGAESKEMVDSMLILQSSDDDTPTRESGLLPARYRKTGFYWDKSQKTIIGKITSDITDINSIIDQVEKMGHQDRSQKHQTVDRLDSNGSGDLIL